MADETLTEVPAPLFTTQKLEELIKNLILTKPFFGYTLSRIDRRIDANLPAPAALDIESLNILINPVTFAQFTPLEQLAVLEHEILHYAFFHPMRFRTFYDRVRLDRNYNLAKRLNIAMDAAINQLIANIPDGCITLQTIEEMVAYIFSKKPEVYNHVLPTVEAKKSSEYYFKLINHELEGKGNGNGNGEGEGEGEPSDGEQSEFDKHKHLFQGANQFNQQEMDNIIAGAKEMQRSEDRRAGTAHGSSILDMLPTAVENVHDKIWKNLIEKAFGENLDPQKETLYGRPGRRKEECNYYKRSLTVSTTVYIGLDTSASVGNEEIMEFLGYVNRGIKKFNTEVVLIQCDTQVDHVEKLRRVMKTDVKYAVHGRGGTNLISILDYIEANEKDPSSVRLILLTDGETPWRKSKIKTSVVYTERHSKMTDVLNWAVMHKTEVFDA